MRIDAHLHLAADTPDSLARLAGWDVRLVNICVAGGRDWRPQREIFAGLATAHPDRFAWITTFDLPRYDDPGYAAAVIAELDADLAEAGCVGVKVWKNIGMECRRPDGSFAQIDDPLFDPIFDHLDRAGATVLMHLGEPLACWQPLDDENPHSHYYRDHPEWHMYTRPDYPHHSTIMAARDRRVARHPGLRFVGAHLASLEWDVAVLAETLDRLPNLAVDTSARVGDLMRQDPATVRTFVTHYADRILWGTDVVSMTPHSRLPADQQPGALGWYAACLAAEQAYYETAGPVSWRGRSWPGLSLAGDVLERIYQTSARTWYPRLRF